MQLTGQQFKHFHTFGFLVFPALLRPDEVIWIKEEFEQVLHTHGAIHDGSRAHPNCPDARSQRATVHNA